MDPTSTSNPGSSREETLSEAKVRADLNPGNGLAKARNGV